MTIKPRLKLKNRSQIYDINKARPRHQNKYTKYKIYLSIMIFISIKQHLSKISRLIHDKS